MASIPATAFLLQKTVAIIDTLPNGFKQATEELPSRRSDATTAIPAKIHWRLPFDQSIIRAMRLWCARPEEPSSTLLSRSARKLCPAIVWGISLCILDAHAESNLLPRSAEHLASSVLARQSGKTASSYVGSAMAVLATLEQAQVLPPEGTKEADRVIQSVIQLQSLFAQSTDSAVQDFVRRAVARTHREQAAALVAEFQSNGWTPVVLTALADATVSVPVETLQPLASGLGSVNMSVEDFQKFMELVKTGEQALDAGGRTFHDVFGSFRQHMPGAAGHK